MKRNVITVKEDRVCKVCRNVIRKGEKAVPRVNGNHRTYLCIDCHNKISKTDVFVYQPSVNRIVRRRYMVKGLLKDEAGKTCYRVQL